MDLASASAAHQKGDLKAAERGYREVLAADPLNFDAIQLLAMVFSQTGRHAEAENLFSRARGLQPDHPSLAYNEGQAALLRADWPVAARLLAQAAESAPDIVELQSRLGHALFKLGRHEEAHLAYDRAFTIDPSYASAYLSFAEDLEDVGAVSQATEILKLGARRCPGNASLSYKLAMLLQAQGAHDFALARLDVALAQAPINADAHVARGVSLHVLGDQRAAAQAYERALALNPALPAAHSNASVLLHDIGQFENAKVAAQRAVELAPDYAEAHSNLGNALKDLGEIAQSIQAFDRALELRPEFTQARVNRAVARLTAGQLREGFDDYEARWHLSDPRIRRHPVNLPQPPDAASLNGKSVLVWWEQGLGDTLQFSLYIDRLKQLGASVVFEVQPELETFLAANTRADRVVTSPLAEGVDYQLPLMSVPRLLKSELSDIPTAGDPYRADPKKIVSWRERIAAGVQPRIGVVWAGNPARDGDRRRSLPLKPLLEAIPDRYQLIALQRHISPADRQFAVASGRIELHDERLEDFSDTAALCSIVDLVVTVDTSVAHLAGVMKKETLLLLERVPAWRWFLDRSDSPWYPSMRLLRQPSSDNWPAVLEELGKRLSSEAGNVPPRLS